MELPRAGGEFWFTRKLGFDFFGSVAGRKVSLPFLSDYVFAVVLHKHTLGHENCQV